MIKDYINMKILITGINGFIGGHLANSLIEKGHSVKGLDIQEESKISGLENYFKGDVLDKEAVKRAMQGVEAVVHLAAKTSHQDIVDNRFETLQINFLGTTNVLDFFLNSETAKKFIYSSSGKVYGDIKFLPLTEEHPALPLNILGKSKFITERLIDFYSAESSKSFIVFRIFNVFGSGQKESFLIPNILNQLKSANRVNLGNTKPRRDYIYIKDVVSAFVSALEKKVDIGFSVFNVCSGKDTNAEEIVSIVSQIKKQPTEMNINQSLFVRLDEKEIEYGSFNKIKNVIGWEPSFSLERGLEEMIKISSL